MRIRTAVIGACTAAVVTGAAVGAAGCGSSTATIDPVAQAADVTQQQPGERMRFTERLSVAALPQPITITGTGFVSQRQRAGVLAFDLSTIPGASALPGSKTMQMVFQFPVMYMKAGFLASALPGHKSWMKLDLQKATQAAGISVSQLATAGGSDPSQYLNFLRGSGGVTKVGSETVNGASTTHYKATIDLSTVADRVPAAQRAGARTAVSQMEKVSGISSLPVDVWVDGSRRVRREQFGIHANPPGGAGALNGTATVDFLSFGPTPAITPPPASEVFDATRVAAAGIKKATGG